ncbi:hypothetical protein IWW52_005578 [Coemansia sp. RSA 2704]|nr:hypothetical protein IWW52_005578 [Coemansia sp. RSA 2704]
MKSILILLLMLGSPATSLPATPAANTSATSPTNMLATNALSGPELEPSPIWFARTPQFTRADQHQTDYLLCKQAHGGQARWTDSHSECGSCFCLPDTRQIGCTRCPRELLRRAAPPPRGQRKTDHATSSLGGYVNYEACVRANSGRTFVRGCNRCVCRQNGAVSCSQVTPCKSV